MGRVVLYFVVALCLLVMDVGCSDDSDLQGLQCNGGRAGWERVVEQEYEETSINDSVSVEFVESCGDSILFVIRNHLPQPVWYLDGEQGPFNNLYIREDTGWRSTLDPMYCSITGAKAIAPYEKEFFRSVLPAADAYAPVQLVLFLSFREKPGITDDMPLPAERMLKSDIIQPCS